MKVSRSLWRDAPFLLFWSGRSISWLGTTITSVVLPLLVYRLTSSALLTSLLGVLQVIPYLVFGLFAGALADRVNRKPLMVICDLANVVLLGSIPVVAAFHHLTIAQIYAVSLLSAVAFVWFDAANFGALPAVVGRERIVSAISYLTTAEDLVLIVGPSLAGLLAALLSPAFAISVDAVSYALSALSIPLIPRAFNTARVQAPGRKFPLRHTFGDIRAGLSFLVKRIPIGWITLVSLCLTPLLVVGLGDTSSFVPALLLYGGWNACYSLAITNGIGIKRRMSSKTGPI